MADISGVALAAFCRSQLLNKPLPRAARHPTINQKEVARLVGQIGSLQEQLDDIAKTNNDHALLSAIHRDLSDIRMASFQALGRKP